ncbi:hypothetical protein PLANPX_4279 [Lacipirellula parvula]|uniref:Uncharacterized protein n=1 Tax=Lacipirellula parvula TaxID=2650471 RepID=A0A5K7XF42_9BACT|nr:hypothetical protein PLANPX_4279 [Lacipirellula parvula]
MASRSHCGASCRTTQFAHAIQRSRAVISNRSRQMQAFSYMETATLQSAQSIVES